VRQGEHPAFDDPRDGTASANERAEVYEYDGVSGPQSQPFNTSLWFSGALRILTQAPNTASYCILSQHTATKDAGDISASPVFALALNAANELTIDTRTSTANPLLGNPAPTIHYTDAAFPRGSLVRFVWNIQFDPQGSGFLRVWRDGTQIVNYTGPIGYVDALGPYWKAGIYRATAADPFVVEWSNLEGGTADLSARIANPLP